MSKFNHGDFPNACSAFISSYKTYPVAASAYMASYCYEKMLDYINAIRYGNIARSHHPSSQILAATDSIIAHCSSAQNQKETAPQTSGGIELSAHPLKVDPTFSLPDNNGIPISALNADGRKELFNVTGSGDVIHKWETVQNGNWVDWTSMGAHDLKKIAIGYQADGRLQIFAIGVDRTLYSTKQIVPNGSWDPHWVKFEGHDLVEITAENSPDKRIKLIVSGMDGRKYTMYQSSPNGSSFGNWSLYIGK